MLTQSRLKELFKYDPSTGLFTRLTSRGGYLAGSCVGSLTNYGYISIRIDKRSYLAHRLAWLYMTGEWPEADIDHKDLNRANNVWSNLRAANRSQNMGNTELRVTNTSGRKGVHRYRNRWCAGIKINGKRKHLGYFDDLDAASAAYEKAANEYYGEFTRT